MTALSITVGEGRHPLSVSTAGLELARALWHALGWALLEPRARVARVAAVLLVRGLIAPVVLVGMAFAPRVFFEVVVAVGPYLDLAAAWLVSLGGLL